MPGRRKEEAERQPQDSLRSGEQMDSQTLPSMEGLMMAVEACPEPY